jgi:hypothetical protein
MKLKQRKNKALNSSINQFIIWLFILPLSLYGQNKKLILNGSFEAFYIDSDRGIPHGWILTNSVDYFSTEFLLKDGWLETPTAPKNFDGFQYAQDGNAYLGFVYLFSYFQFREFISARIDTAMQNGETYKIEFYISLSDSSRHNANRISFWFSDKLNRTYFKRKEVLLAENPIILENLNFNKTDWVKVSYLYTANGSEVYFNIGNCLSCISRSEYRKIMGKMKWKTDKDDHSVYYYIDNVSIVHVPKN